MHSGGIGIETAGVDPELILRLAGERVLRQRDQRGGRPGGAGLGEVGLALSLVAGLERASAEQIVDDYELALAVRGVGLPLQFRQARRRQPSSAPTLRVAPPTVFTVDQVIPIEGSDVRVSYVAFDEDEASVVVDYLQPAAVFGRQSPRQHRHDVELRDDAGTTAQAGFSGGGGPQGYRGRWSARGGFSSTASWFEVDGHRLMLGSPVPSAVTTVEDLDLSDPPAGRLMRHRLAAQDHRFHGDDDIVEWALTRAGLLKPATSWFTEYQDIRQALDDNGPRKKLPEPWRSLRSLPQGRHPADDEEPGAAVNYVACTPIFENMVVRLSELRLAPDQFTAHAEVTGRVQPHGGMTSGVPDLPVAWWARDDIGNHYLGSWGNYSGGDGQMSGEMSFHGVIPAAARRLTIMPTGWTQRAVIEIPLDGPR